MKMQMKIPKNVVSGTTAFLFWALIIGCFIFSVRSSGLAAQAKTYVMGRAVSPEQVENQRKAEETAKSFALEWATFDKNNPKNYQNRMGQFIEGYRGDPPGGCQECTQASVLSVQQDYSQYRVKLMLHLKRIVVVDDIKSDASRIMTPRDIVDIVNPSTQKARPQEWQTLDQCVEVAVEIKDQQPIVLGAPVIMPMPESKQSTLVYPRERPPEEFETFVTQALEFYYSGKDMENYTALGVKIPALGGYQLSQARILSFEQKEDQATAVVEATISTTGLNSMKQEIVLETLKKDKWTIKRMGSW